MQTYYIDNTSGSVRNLLLIQKYLSSDGDLAGTDFDISVPIPWFNGDKQTADVLVDFLSAETSDCIDIYDDQGSIVASTHPVEPTERGNPKVPGQYLCHLEEKEIVYGKKRERFWMVLGFDKEWITDPVWRVIRWLHLPRA